MNCQSIKPLLSGFAEETLDAATMWQVQTHLSGCMNCAQTSREFASMKRMLKALPTAAPSAGFDAALAQRLALTRRPVRKPQTGLAKIFALRVPCVRPLHRLRPALALGLVVAAGTWTAFFPGRSVAPTPPAAVRGADPAFVAECVAQHHRDTASEPLADLSAQTLAGSLDGAAAADASGAETSTDSSTF